MNKFLTLFIFIFFLFFIQCGLNESNSITIENASIGDSTGDIIEGLTLLSGKKTLHKKAIGEFIKFKTELVTNENTTVNFKTPHLFDVSIGENTRIIPVKNKKKIEIWKLKQGKANFVNNTPLKVIIGEAKINSVKSSFKIIYDVSTRNIDLQVEKGNILFEYSPIIVVKDKTASYKDITKKQTITRNDGLVVISLNKIDPNYIFNSKKEAKKFFNRKNKKEESIYNGNVSITTKNNFVFIEGGLLIMGCKDGSDDEKPVHQVKVDSFWMNKYEVTFEEYDKFCKDTNRQQPSDEGWGRESRPVINVSWNDAINYCNWLSEKENLSPVYIVKGKQVTWDFSLNGYRLPTEAEWEFAARGGNFTHGYDYSGSDDIDAVGWYSKNTNKTGTKEVGLKKANELGIFDMTGNALEWCWDWHSIYSKSDSPVKNPTGPKYGFYKIARGGAWDNKATDCRVSVRFHNTPNSDYYFGYGFRLVRNNM